MRIISSQQASYYRRRRSVAHTGTLAHLHEAGTQRGREACCRTTGYRGIRIGPGRDVKEALRWRHQWFGGIAFERYGPRGERKDAVPASGEAPAGDPRERIVLPFESCVGLRIS